MPSALDYQAIVAAPGFALGIAVAGPGVREIRFLPPQTPVAPVGDLASEAARQVAAYLEDPDFRFDLPLNPAGTDFQRRVWARIAAIPRGAAHTYGQLARDIGSAPRAVGQACGANPYPLVVPCHRVIARDGGLGGFARQGGGLLLDIKRWLLRHEGLSAG